MSRTCKTTAKSQQRAFGAQCAGFTGKGGCKAASDDEHAPQLQLTLGTNLVHTAGKLKNASDSFFRTKVQMVAHLCVCS